MDKAQARTRAKVNKRFPNSIHDLKPSICPSTGVYESSVHSGHVGQPKPDPVRRTIPPVRTMPV